MPDHIPPAALHNPRGKDQSHKNDVPDGGVRLFPQCRQCSNRQKNDVSSEKHRIRRGGGETNAGKIAAVTTHVNEDFDRNIASYPNQSGKGKGKGKGKGN